jgi:hypothetical protein
MKPVAIAIIIFWVTLPLSAQTNLLVTNPDAEAVLLGNFDPANYVPAVVIDDPAAIAAGLFSGFAATDTEEALQEQNNIELLQNHPNPFDEATVISVFVTQAISHQEASIVVYSMQGKELARLPIALQPGLNEVLYDYNHHNYVPGTYAYSLVIDGKVIATRQMVYAY